MQQDTDGQNFGRTHDNVAEIYGVQEASCAENAERYVEAMEHTCSRAGASIWSTGDGV
jgi:hypothetical protein